MANAKPWTLQQTLFQRLTPVVNAALDYALNDSFSESTAGFLNALDCAVKTMGRGD